MAPTSSSNDTDIDMDEFSSGAVSDAVTNPMPRQETSKVPGRATLWLVVFGVLVIGASIAGGYFLAMQQGTTAEVVSDAGQSTANAEIQEGVEGESTEADEPEIAPDPEDSESDSSATKETGIDVLVDLAGARVSLDGHYLGQAPLRVRNILPGSHKIVVTNADGSKVSERVVELLLGEAKVISMVLDESAEPVKVVRDDKPDKHKRAEDKKDRERRNASRTDSSDDEGKVAAPVSHSAAEKVLLGTLMLGSKPPCAIEIDGKATGKNTPQRAIQLPEGLHRVVLTNEAQSIRKSFKVVIKAGRTTRAIQDLRQKL